MFFCCLFQDAQQRGRKSGEGEREETAQINIEVDSRSNRERYREREKIDGPETKSIALDAASRPYTKISFLGVRGDKRKGKKS